MADRRSPRTMDSTGSNNMSSGLFIIQAMTTRSLTKDDEVHVSAGSQNIDAYGITNIAICYQN